MGQARLPVRKIREVLRLKAEVYSDRQIALSIGSSRSTVQACLQRAREVGVAWPLPLGKARGPEAAVVAAGAAKGAGSGFGCARVPSGQQC